MNSRSLSALPNIFERAKKLTLLLDLTNKIYFRSVKRVDLTHATCSTGELTLSQTQGKKTAKIRMSVMIL